MTSWIPKKNEMKYLELVLGMTSDSMLGRGTETKESYLLNLEAVIRCLRGMSEEEK